MPKILRHKKVQWPLWLVDWNFNAASYEIFGNMEKNV